MIKYLYKHFPGIRKLLSQTLPPASLITLVQRLKLGYGRLVLEMQNLVLEVKEKACVKGFFFITLDLSIQYLSAKKRAYLAETIA